MVTGPVDSPGPLSKVADHAAQNDAEHVAVRFSPGGHHAAVRAYAWALDGSDAATFELTSAGQPVRTAEAPPPLPPPSPPLHEKTSLDDFMTLVLNGRPEVLAMDPPNVAYLTVNRHNIVYGAKVDFSKGDPPYIARVTIEQEGGQLTGVCDVVDTQTGSAARYTRPLKKRLLRRPIPCGAWSRPHDAASILAELRATMARG